MDAILLLRQMHADQKVRFKQILGTPDPTIAAQLWAELQPLLELHERIEDVFVYEPLAMQQGPDTPLGDWDVEHDVQVGEVKKLIAQADTLQPADPTWRTLVGTINAMLHRHIMEEEMEIFPRIDMLWPPAERERAGKQMQAEIARSAPEPLPAA
jgi:hypothetical protein